LTATGSSGYGSNGTLTNMTGAELTTAILRVSEGLAVQLGAFGINCSRLHPGEERYELHR